MSTHLFIGSETEGAKQTRLDTAILIDSRMLICANSGGGKSYLLRLIAEQALAGKETQVIILDPEGEFVSLREKYDIALVGEGGEIATGLPIAEILGRKLFEHQVSAIVDLYELKLQERRIFVRDFITALMSAPRSQWHPTLVLLDEAHLFAPEQGQALSTDAVIALMSQGRKRAICGILATQRISKLHKDAAAETNNVVIGRTWLDNDQTRAGDLLGFDKARRSTLRDLEPGHFYAFGPAFNFNGVQEFSAKKSITTHPKPGQRHLAEVPPASKNLSRLIESLGDLPEEAEQEARTIAELQHQNAVLQRELRTLANKVVRPVEVVKEKIVQVPILDDTSKARLVQIQEAQSTISDMLQRIGAQVEKAGLPTHIVHAPDPYVQQISDEVRDVALEVITHHHLQKAADYLRKNNRSPMGEIVDTLSSGEQRILTALAQYPEGRYKVQLAILSGYKHNGGGFNNLLGSLRVKGFIEGDNKSALKITRIGLEALGPVEPLPHGKALIEYWNGKLDRAPKLILNALTSVYPDALGKVELANQTGYESSGGGFNNALGKLRTLGLIHGSNKLKASEVFFQ